jgi:hypothetical protein
LEQLGELDCKGGTFADLVPALCAGLGAPQLVQFRQQAIKVLGQQLLAERGIVSCARKIAFSHQVKLTHALIAAVLDGIPARRLAFHCLTGHCGTFVGASVCPRLDSGDA